MAYLTEDKARKKLIDSVFIRSDLVKRRSQLIERPFFKWRPRLKNIVKAIDSRLADLDENMTNYRKFLLAKR